MDSTVSQTHVHSPQRPSPPPHSSPSTSLPACTNIPEERSITDNGNNCSTSPVLSLHQNGDTSSTPLHHDHQGNKNDIPHSPKSSSSTTRAESSPLKVAASLIQSLDIAHTEMSSFAADAAADAEKARRNARTAQEIARRYQNRSYPTFKMDALEASSSTTKCVASITAASSSSFIITSRPKRPEITRFHYVSPSRKSTLDGFKGRNWEEKDYENDGNQEKKNDDNDDAGVHLTTPVVFKQSRMQDKTSSCIKNRVGFHSPTSFERIAQHHADDVLQLTQEWERTKQALKSEQRLHKDCKLSLASLQSKKIKLKNINQKLVEKHDIERNKSKTQISHLGQELELSRLRLQAAEEDAQLALDLAKDSAEQRDKIEESFVKAQKEIEMLKDQRDGKLQLATVKLPKRYVHFADNDDNIIIDKSTSTDLAQIKGKASAVINSPRENGPPRSMIAAGRQLLLRRSMSPQNAVIRLDLSPTKSVERRQQLCRRLNEHLNESSHEDANIMLLSSSPSRTPLSPTPGINTATSGYISDCSSINGTVTKKKLEENHTAMKILQISGNRLDLDGYWWREHSNTMPSHNRIQIDIMTRQYCQNVEFKIGRQQKDINQLESLCGYLEKKLFLDDEPAES